MGDPGLSLCLKHSCIEVRSLGTPRKSTCRLAEGSPQLEGHSVVGARCMEVNWGREKQWCHGGEGTLSMERPKGEKEREIEKVWHQFLTKGKPLWTTDWGAKSAEFHRVVCLSVSVFVCFPQGFFFFHKLQLELKL